MSDEDPKDSLSSESAKLDPNDAFNRRFDDVNFHNIPDEELTPEQRLRKLSHRVINMTASNQLMVETVIQMSQGIKNLTEETYVVAQQIGDVEKNRRRDRLVGGFCILVLSLVVIIGSVVISSVRGIAKNNSEQLQILREATSPETQAKQAAATELIVQRIDCNSQEGLRRVLQGIPTITVPPRTEICEKILGKTNP